MNLAYRADINGLKAIAILLIVFFHAELKGFQGGFIGVDVFFVISGYLITSIIFGEIQTKKFSLIKFYGDRLLRIFPTLFIVMIFVLVLGAFLFSAADLKELGQSVTATTLFHSNLFFSDDIGYFDTPADYKPLLHTWYVAIQMQYYIFFPLLLILFTGIFRARHKFWLPVLTFVALAISIYATQNEPLQAYYWASARAWEFLLGAILSVGIIPFIDSKRLCNALAFLGLVFIAASAFFYTPETFSAGFSGILPALGAGFLIYSGFRKDSFIRRLLNIKPLVFIGLISYSIYLWHWPLLVFAKYYIIRELTNFEIFAILILAFIFSVLSWRFIERKFDLSKLKVKIWQVFAALMALMVFSISLGFIIDIRNGFPERFGSVQNIEEDSEWEGWRDCMADTTDPKTCLIGSENAEPTFVLWGDSHAVALASGIDESAKEKGRAGLLITKSSCTPLLGINKIGKEYCVEFNNNVLEYINNQPDLETIILSSRWATCATGKRYKNEKGEGVELVDIWTNANQDKINAELFEAGITRLVSKLLEMDRRVVLVEQVPEIGYRVPNVASVTKERERNIEALIAPTIEEYRKRNKEVSLIFNKLNNLERVQIVEVSEKLCGTDKCRLFAHGIPLYRDDDHLSTYGSYYVSEVFDPLFSNLPTNK